MSTPKVTPYRRRVNSLLWSAAGKLPNGTELVRDAVGAVNNRDQTNQAARGTAEYFSTKLLSDKQLLEIAVSLRDSAKLPPPTSRPPGPQGGRPRRPEGASPDKVAHIATPGEHTYIASLFEHLGFTPENRESFIARQTKGHGLTTHKACSAVTAPLERMLRARGWTIAEHGRTKTLTPPGRPL